ncbi:MAG: carbon-nitrogen hydrolase family protein [Thermomicrobiales bacterium]|nr:carbon-nitrogen hydrolase family protein [Thermomicrobiales bacterium]
MDGSSERLSVAVVQMNSRDDKQANIEAALAGIDRAALGGARFVTLPEIWPYLGPDRDNYENAEPIPGRTSNLLAERARRHGIHLHAGSMLERVDGRELLLNTSIVFDPQGDIVARYSKIHMFDVVLDGVASYRESATVAPGDAIVTVDIDGFTVGLTICYDLRFPELFRILALRGADAIVLPAAFTMTTGKDHWETLIRARAIENQLYMIAPAQVGQHPPGNWSYGRSMIVDPWGTVLATAPDEETVIFAELSKERTRAVRRQVPSLANRQPTAYAWPQGEPAGAGRGIAAVR